MAEELRDRTVGELLEQAFSLVFRKFGKLFLIQLLFFLGVAVAAGVLCVPAVFLIGSGGFEAAVGVMFGLVFIVAVLILSPLPNAASIITVSDEFTGRDHTVLECYRAAFPYIVRLLLLGLVVGILVFLGFLLFIIPGIIVALTYMVATQAMVVEDLGLGDAMGRSAQLTKGNKWRILGLVLCVFIITTVVSGVFAAVGAALGAAGGGSFASLLEAGISRLGSTIANMFFACATIAVYFDLRVRKDAFHLEQLSEIVDRIAPGPEQDEAGG